MHEMNWMIGMKKRLLISAISIFILAQRCFPEESPLSKRDAGTITGTVMNVQEQPVAGAVIILCDQGSGIPVCLDTFKPFTEAYLSKERNQQKEICFSVTDDVGCFSFENVPRGEYKLVAQSWKGAEKIKSIFEKNGEVIHLYGVAERIKVSPDTRSNVVLRPSGTGVLCIDQEAGTLLVLSRSPTRADPILGFAGWGGAFMQDMLGGNRMIHGKTTVYGLPEGTIYLAMFANDNIPGWTEGQAQIKSNQSTVLENIPFVNSWSNSRHDPPEHLLPVFEEVKLLISQKDTFLIELLQDFNAQTDSSKGMLGVMELIGLRLEEAIELPSGKKATFGDVMAAVQYVKLQQTMERKKEQWKRRDETMKQFLDKQAAKKTEAQKDRDTISEKIDVSSPLSFFPDDMDAGKELDELWAIRFQAFKTLSSEQVLEIVRKGFRRTSANKNDIIRTIGREYILNKSTSEPAAVDMLYCASFDSDVMYNAFYYGLNAAKPKSPMVLKRLVDLAMQGYEAGQIAWSMRKQQDEFFHLLEPHLNSLDPIENQQARNVVKMIEGRNHGVYDISKGQTKPEDLEKIRKDFLGRLDHMRQVLLTGSSSTRLAELERVTSLGVFHVFDDTFIPAVQACANDENIQARIKTAEVAGCYWLWGSTMTMPEITRLLIRLSEDDVPDVRFAAVEKGLFNIPDKTGEIIKRIIDVTLADRKQMPDKLYRRIEYVLRVNKEPASEILREYLEGDCRNPEVATALYRKALRLDPSAVKRTISTMQKD
jgi:hypothetical protein